MNTAWRPKRRPLLTLGCGLQSSVDLAFDPNDREQVPPDEGMSIILSDPVATVLWAAIRRQHIVSDHFRRDCLRVARHIYLSKPRTFEDFQVEVYPFTRNGYGVHSVPHNRGRRQRPYRPFWMSIWRVVKVYVHGSPRHEPQKDELGFMACDCDDCALKREPLVLRYEGEVVWPYRYKDIHEKEGW